MIPPMAREMAKKCVASVVLGSSGRSLQSLADAIGDGVSNAAAEEGRGQRPIGGLRSQFRRVWRILLKPPIELSEGNDVRLSLRKAAYSSVALPSSTGNPGSVYTNCETAVARRLITAKAAADNYAK